MFGYLEINLKTINAMGKIEKKNCLKSWYVKNDKVKLKTQLGN